MPGEIAFEDVTFSYPEAERQHFFHWAIHRSPAVLSRTRHESGPSTRLAQTPAGSADGTVTAP